MRRDASWRELKGPLMWVRKCHSQAAFHWDWCMNIFRRVGRALGAPLMAVRIEEEEDALRVIIQNDVCTTLPSRIRRQLLAEAIEFIPVCVDTDDIVAGEFGERHSDVPEIFRPVFKSNG